MATIEHIEIGDEPAAWSALGFAVQDGCCTIGGVSLRLAGPAAGSGILGWALRGIDSATLDGLPTSISTAPPPGTVPAHPNGVVAIDHVVAVSPSFDRSVAALRGAGLDLRRIREEPTPAGAPRQAFFRLGAEILELVAEPEVVTGAKGGSERPAHFWGLALLVDDIDTATAAMAPHTGEPRAAVQPGRRIVSLRRSAGLSVPLALITREHDREAEAGNV